MLEKAKKCTSQVEPGAEHVVFKPLGCLRSGADLEEADVTHRAVSDASAGPEVLYHPSIF